MKLFNKSNSSGFIHYLLPILVVGAIAAIGTYALVVSHADSLPCTNGGNAKVGESVSVWPALVNNTVSGSSQNSIYATLSAYNTPNGALPTTDTVRLERCLSTGASCKVLTTSTNTETSATNVSNWQEYYSQTSAVNVVSGYTYKACSTYTDNTGWQFNRCSPLAT